MLVAEIIDARGRAIGLVRSWSLGRAAALAFWGVSLLAPPKSLEDPVLAGILPGLLIIISVASAGAESFCKCGRSVEYQSEGDQRSGGFWVFSAVRCCATLLATSLSTDARGLLFVSTWLPTFLATERHLSVGGTTGYLLMVIVGSLAGYLTSAWLADAIGRRRGFVLFACCAAALILIYTRAPVTNGMLLIGFPLGFFTLGIFSGMGAYLAELFPSAVRGSGQGFSYSIGRGIAGFCPSLIGALSSYVSLGEAIAGFTVAAYALVIVSAWALPETRGRALGEDRVQATLADRAVET